MESFGTFLDEEWESLSKVFSYEQDHGLNFETHPIVSSVMTDSIIANPSFIDNHDLSYTYDNVNPNLHHCFSQETNGIASSFPCPSSNLLSLPTNDVCDHEPVGFYDEMMIDNNSSLLAQFFSNDAMEEILSLKQNLNLDNYADALSVPTPDNLEHTPSKRKIEMPESTNVVEDKVNDEKLKKTRASRDNKTKKKVQPKKKQKVMDVATNGKENDGEGGIASIACSSSCSSEGDLNGSGATNSNYKTRAGRGAATDPQSLYARKRRERINERLKVLQNLVPNGTKVDISTMLEEAVQYVKFLQLQIKLLSSDEMWMYAPIAYNGMDMGLYQKLAQP